MQIWKTLILIVIFGDIKLYRDKGFRCVKWDLAEPDWGCWRNLLLLFSFWIHSNLLIKTILKKFGAFIHTSCFKKYNKSSDKTIRWVWMTFENHTKFIFCHIYEDSCHFFILIWHVSCYLIMLKALLKASKKRQEKPSKQQHAVSLSSFQ